MKYRFILLDADNTLFDFDACEKNAFFLTMEDLSVKADEKTYVRYSELNNACWRALERGEISREELKVKRFADLAKEFNIPCRPHDVNEKYISHLAKQSILYPGAVELVKELSQSHEVYIITNGLATVQEGRFQHCPLCPHLKNIFISEKIGAQKPEKLFFERVASMIEDFDPQKAIVIGDSLTSDIQGANNMGIDCIWYNPKAHPKGSQKIDYEVSDYDQIIAILKQGDIHEN